jgi:hypothetical protein
MLETNTSNPERTKSKRSLVYFQIENINTIFENKSENQKSKTVNEETMSRYYLYDSYTDNIAEFATSYQRSSQAPSRYRGNEGGRRARPEGKGLADAEIRVTGSGQNPMGRARRSMTQGGALAINDPDLRIKGSNSEAFKSMLRPKLGRALLGTTTAGRAVRGVGALGLAAAGLYGGKRVLDKRKKERSSVKGRIKALLGR